VWDQDPKVWKRDLRAFIKALVRKWPNCWGTWKLEFQKRGAPHFHALLWDGPKVEAIQAKRPNGKLCMIGLPSMNKDLFEWVSGTWYRIVGSEDENHLVAGTRIEPVMSIQGVLAYTGKYLAKTDDQEQTRGTGKAWGIIGRARWKVDEVRAHLDNQEYFRIRRVLRKYRESQTKRKESYRSHFRGQNVFMNEETGERLKVWAFEGRNGCPF